MQGKGLFSAIKGYVGAYAGATHSVAGKYLGATGRGALYGAAAGGLYGAASDDTSVLGGMAAGAGMGALGGRYGPSAMRRGSLGMRGIGVSAPGKMGAVMGAGKGVYNRMRMDARAAGSAMRANQPMQKIRSTLKNWL